MEQKNKFLDFFINRFQKSEQCDVGLEYEEKDYDNFIKKCNSFNEVWKSKMSCFANGMETIYVSASQTYIKSCLYTDHLVDSKVKELRTENQELKSLIYGMLDEIQELKEHNRSLSERLELVENIQIPIPVSVPDLISFLDSVPENVSVQIPIPVPNNVSVPVSENVSVQVPIPVPKNVPIPVPKNISKEETKNKNNSLLAAERRGEIKKNGLVANATRDFKKNFYEIKQDIHQREIIQGWQN